MFRRKEAGQGVSVALPDLEVKQAVMVGRFGKTCRLGLEMRLAIIFHMNGIGDCVCFSEQGSVK